MQIKVNGKKERLGVGVTLHKFISDKKLNTSAVVAELNGEIIKKNNWKAVMLKNGDTLELITFVGGG